MQRSALSEEVTRQAIDFAWSSWAQLGVFATPAGADERAADPEALLVFTLELGRRDPRLFDEVLDWLRENERLLSVQRLRNLSRDERDRQVVDAALRWVSRFRTNPRFGKESGGGAEERTALFGGDAGDVWAPDPHFLQLGLVRPVAEPSFKSRRPDPSRPINFAFRLRLAFGVGSRAEILRYLLTVPAADVSAQIVSEAVAFSKRNVSDALDALVGAGLVSQLTLSNERRYSIDREAWAVPLGVDRFPAYREWPQLLWAVRQTVRFLDDPGLDELSDSMRASAARDLVERIEPSLLFAGVPVLGKDIPGARYWDGFVRTVEGALAALRTP